MKETRGVVFNIQKFCLHDGPGIRTTIFLKGCPLRCLWCANPESQRRTFERDAEGTTYGEETTVNEIMREVVKDKPFYEESGGGVTLSGGEPLYQPDFARAILAACKAEGLHTAIETTGAVAQEVLLRAAEWVDLFLFDVKHYDPEKHKAGTGVDNRQIAQNLRLLTDGGYSVIVRIPVIPAFNAASSDARRFGEWLAGLGVSRVELLPFHQFGERKYALLGKKYAMEGVPPLKEEALAGYKEMLGAYQLSVIV